MIKLDIKVDTAGVVKMLRGFEKQVPYTLATAINNTAFQMRGRLGAELASRLDRPTRWTTGAVRVEKATKGNLVATVLVNASGRPGGSQAELLRQQFTGGGRAPKLYERALRSQGLLGPGEFTVPGAGVSLDANGNPRRSQLLQILKALGGQKAQATKRRSKTLLAGTIFWSRGDKGLAKGAWQKVAGGVKPLLIVVTSTTYRQRVPFHQIAREEFDRRWPGNAQAAVQRAIETAK